MCEHQPSVSSQQSLGKKMKSAVNDLKIYRESMEIGEVIWSMVQSWDFFAKDTVGKQLVRSADSIAANLSEGYGRYHFKENQKFCYYSRGSAEETQTWLEKAARRDLIDREVARTLYERIENYKKRLNAYIRTIGASDASSR
jgi:four helix bundle protein